MRNLVIQSEETSL